MPWLSLVHLLKWVCGMSARAGSSFHCPSLVPNQEVLDTCPYVSSGHITDHIGGMVNPMRLANTLSSTHVYKCVSTKMGYVLLAHRDP